MGLRSIKGTDTVFDCQLADEPKTSLSPRLYTYDSTNKIIRAELTWEKNGNIEQRKTITYKYKKTDSKGNWIERVAKSNSGESKEETRTIEYY